MIVSERHRFFFLHNRKAAGSSISVSLARYLGPIDLQLSAITETVSAGIPLTDRVVREATSQTHCLLPLARVLGSKVYGRMVSRSIDHRYRPLLGRKPPHSPAEVVATAFPDQWRSFRKFCVVRNPWDKTVSDYFWRTKALVSPPSFSDYVSALANGDSLNGIVPLEFHDNWLLYTINERIVADHVVRFEALADELSSVMNAIGIEWDGWLPRSKSGTRQNHPYRDMYDASTIKIVGDLYAKEIDAFGYTF